LNPKHTGYIESTESDFLIVQPLNERQLYPLIWSTYLVYPLKTVDELQPLIETVYD
jgi:hypothetical protein